jgi:hypothetical protein
MHTSPNPREAYRAGLAEFVDFLFAYLDLLVARREAAEQGLEPASKAVPLTHFRGRGTADSILLWLLFQAHIEHLHLVPGVGRAPDGTRPADSLLLGETSCFTLTDRGEAFADGFLAGVFAGKGPELEAAWDLLLLGRLTPRYDREDRVFAWGHRVLKCFRQPSQNQEIIRCAGEELGWPPWFDDPLPRSGGRWAGVRLHNTIKALNRHQEPYLVHFKGDGSGRRVGWEYR